MELTMPQTMRVSNSRDYNSILKNKGKVFILMHRILQAESLLFLKKRKNKQKYSDDLILSMYMVAYVLHLPLRQTCGFFEDYIEQNRIIVQIPDYTTLCRRLKKLTVYISQAKRKDWFKGKELAIDSTCLNIYSNTGGHSKDFSSTRKHKGYDQVRKMHVALDIQSKEVDELICSTWSMADHIGFLGLVDQLADKYMIESIRADRAYDKTCCYQACHDCDIEAIIPPFVNAVKKASEIFISRNKAIDIMSDYETYEEGLSAWKKETGYSKRSLVEAFFSRFKKTFGFHLRSKSEANREQEMRIKCKIMNYFARLGMPTFKLA